MKAKVLVLDNYDSFTYNLVHIIRELGYKPDVIRNDKMQVDDVMAYDKILLSPGPGVPDEAGIMKEVIKTYAASKSILGVCLGHQGIGEVFGAQLYNIQNVLHGVATQLEVSDLSELLFAEVPRQFQVGHYHSWAIEPGSLNGALRVTALNESGMVMAIAHAQYDVRGVQFHPESVLTEHGKKIIENWLQK
ncbi:MAG: aminodeoxychorismate/anthranilate synthase component II [Cyclobacteriaceae bacterium]